MTRPRALPRLVVLLSVAALLAPALAAEEANSPEEHYNRGNRLYKEGHYAEAVKQYQASLAAGARAPDVYYNLGNAHFQAGDLGRAVLAYERARRLAPRDKQVLENLQQVNLLLRDEIPDTPRAGLAAALELGVSQVALDELTRVASLFLLLLVAVLIAGQWLENELPRRLLGGAAVVLGVLLVFSLGAAGLKAHALRADRSAVVLEEEVAVRSGPSKNFDTAFQLHAGSLITVVETRGLWNRIEAGPKLSGWLPRTAVERVVEAP